MKVVALAGGFGGARFLLGLRAALRIPSGNPSGTGTGNDPGGSDTGGGAAGHEVTALVNICDDIWLHGLRICPDLDTCMYTLSGGIDPERGWGRADETWTV